MEYLPTRENNNTFTNINKSTNCKSHQKDSLLSSMSNIMEDDDEEMNTINNPNLHSAKSSKFNTHFSYFNNK